MFVLTENLMNGETIVNTITIGIATDDFEDAKNKVFNMIKKKDITILEDTNILFKYTFRSNDLMVIGILNNEHKNNY